MSLRAMGHIQLGIMLALGGLSNEAAQAGEPTCPAPQLYANLTKSDSKWEVEADPLPPEPKMEVGSVAFQPVQRMTLQGGAIFVAPFRSDFKKARIRVVGHDVSLDRIQFQYAPFPHMWEALMVERYAQPSVRFTLSASDGACGARALVLTIDGMAAAKPFPIQQWQFTRK
ncbi:hypothetical protein [Bradyrhizobium sp. HKCCYLS3077]|uniref:hypothetical protein n=1 Tax=Bradyrhizobium sp. HKCCYLS3077 TaxID=3420761 RepID=UPI003EBCB3B4